MSELRGPLKNPHIATHGSFSTMLNFHSLQLFIDELTAPSSSSKPSDGKAFMRISPFGEGFKTSLIVMGLDHTDVPMTSWSFDEQSSSLGPDQISSLQRAESEQINSDTTVLRAMGLLRLCNYDADVFMKFANIFIKAVGNTDTTNIIRKDIGTMTKYILNKYYHIRSIKDMWFELGRINMGLGHYNQALHLFQTSNEKCGIHHVTHHNIGICFFYVKKYNEAIDSFNVALKIKSTYKETIKWKEKVEKIMKENKNGN